MKYILYEYVPDVESCGTTRCPFFGFREVWQG